MDTRTGDIYRQDQVERMPPEERRFMREMQLVRGKVGRNEPCPCGSGKKFKRCCLARR